MVDGPNKRRRKTVSNAIFRFVTTKGVSEKGVVKKELRETLPPPIVGTMKRSAFSTNAHSRFASIVLDTVKGPPHLVQHINKVLESPVPEATHDASQGPLKGAVSAQKALRDGDGGVAGRNYRD